MYLQRSVVAAAVRAVGFLLECTATKQSAVGWRSKHRRRRRDVAAEHSLHLLEQRVLHHARRRHGRAGAQPASRHSRSNGLHTGAPHRTAPQLPLCLSAWTVCVCSLLTVVDFICVCAGAFICVSSVRYRCCVPASFARCLAGWRRRGSCRTCTTASRRLCEQP